MTRCVDDLPLFVKHIKGTLAGLAGTYVDDYILAGNETFAALMNNTAERVESKMKVSDKFFSAEIEVAATLTGFCLHQGKRIEKRMPMTVESTSKELESPLVAIG
ncbi:hypothetical protein BWQ96_02845 [Gracilariopsis chorda]|uniref:Uncharacterized protein n=1 Tax=Gracilariopsis chorda TaxID=448386 RepID=A0A2V3IZ65_9FLOR|nr:hypothetical protein BWQ96_02845 [Gracilariopsis chorda]|eukprot:PXF47365.1 hypothetical protein BWQ96_02845 [Gracilariopsis chorda]